MYLFHFSHICAHMPSFLTLCEHRYIGGNPPPSLRVFEHLTTSYLNTPFHRHRQALRHIRHLHWHPLVRSRVSRFAAHSWLWSDPVGARRRRAPPPRAPTASDGKNKTNAPIIPIWPLPGDSAPWGVMNMTATRGRNGSHCRGGGDRSARTHPPFVWFLSCC